MAFVSITGNYEDTQGNTVSAPSELRNVQVEFNGSNNKLVIDSDSGIHNTKISFPADDGVCIVGPQGNYCGKIRVGWKCLVSIGSRITCTTACSIYTAENTYVLIGDDCMFASAIIIRTEDSHAIYDVESGKRINPSRNVAIGQHVWLAEDALILSGSRIGAGSTIAARAVVKGVIPNNCVAAGIPCKVLKRNTAWERPNLAFAQPWVRNNAKDQSLVTSTQAWKLTNESETRISLGRPLYTVLRDSKILPSTFDLSTFSM